MNKHTQQLMLLSPQALQNRVETLKAEADRKHGTLPTKLLAWTSALFSLLAVGLNTGFISPMFILLSLFVAIYAVVITIGAWGLWSNLHNSRSALQQITS